MTIACFKPKWMDEEIEMLIEAAVRQMKMEDGTVAK